MCNFFCLYKNPNVNTICRTAILYYCILNYFFGLMLNYFFCLIAGLTQSTGKIVMMTTNMYITKSLNAMRFYVLGDSISAA